MQHMPSPESFPVDAILPDLFQALAQHKRAVLTASPGSGKTTRIPLALLGLLPSTQQGQGQAPLSGTVLVLEPRRLAARSAANYMAQGLGEKVGESVGYRVRLDSKISSKTRVELLTEGMFTRRLLADPELQGVSCVIFDEFHERSLQADVGMALCLECAQAFRPDLHILVMSATLKGQELCHYLGDCPLIEAQGRNWPVSIDHAPPELCVSPGQSLEELAVKTARAVHQTLQDEHGSILVFLPGQAEIRRTASKLEKLPQGVTLHSLYGDLPQKEQDAAIAPPLPGTRKIVLATDIAQTSLTIEGIRVVIDAGLARAPRFDPATGLNRLVTGRLTQDAADQRAGRAGRLDPGRCLRLWAAGEHLLPQVRPEIQDADLAPLYLEALSWGSNPENLPWLTPPPQPALHEAVQCLLALEAIKKQGKDYVLTPHGQQLALLPLHPRLAHMVRAANDFEEHPASLACCLAALVTERDPLRQQGNLEQRTDIRLRLPLFSKPENRRLQEVARHIYRLSGLSGSFELPAQQDENFCGALLSLAWPERIAKQRATGSFRMASGQGAELGPHDALAKETWLAIAQLGGGTNHRIHLAASLHFDDITRLHAHKVSEHQEIFWDSRSESVCCRSVRRLGELILEEKNLENSPQRENRMLAVLLEGIVALGLEALPWTPALRQLQARVHLLRSLDLSESGNTDWPDIGDDALLDSLRLGLTSGAEKVWLAPYLLGITRRTQFASIDLAAALRSLLPWPLAEQLNKQAPEQIPLPSGSVASLDYLPALHGQQPVLSVKLQEMFGQNDSPRLAGGRCPVLVHLLSPAGRPLQVTADLRHFWQHGYKEVRAEMRGRYPKHPWPEDPLSAQPTGKTKKRLDAEARR